MEKVFNLKPTVIKVEPVVPRVYEAPTPSEVRLMLNKFPKEIVFEEEEIEYIIDTLLQLFRGFEGTIVSYLEDGSVNESQILTFVCENYSELNECEKVLGNHIITEKRIMVFRNNTLHITTCKELHTIIISCVGPALKL